MVELSRQKRNPDEIYEIVVFQCRSCGWKKSEAL